jgi:hypothetical protein
MTTSILVSSPFANEGEGDTGDEELDSFLAAELDPSLTSALSSDHLRGGSSLHLASLPLPSSSPSALPQLVAFDNYSVAPNNNNNNSSLASASTNNIAMNGSLGLPSPSSAFDPRAIKATSPYYSQLMAPPSVGNGLQTLDIVDAVDAAGSDDLLDSVASVVNVTNVGSLHVDIKAASPVNSVASGILSYLCALLVLLLWAVATLPLFNQSHACVIISNFVIKMNGSFGVVVFVV